MARRISQERVVSEAQLRRLSGWSRRKPVIALMGEFSSGKSSLMNLLIGQNILPTQVTATRMPPVWLRYGEGAPSLVDHAGRHHPVNLADRDSIPLAKARYIRLWSQAAILKDCDLIDTPGISDPNIPVGSWIRTVGFANAVIWCTHAGQAWRESERACWEDLPARLRQHSLLLVTRKDKITSDLDLRKIERRLEREAGPLFQARRFISLTNALRARAAGDGAGWTDSGAPDIPDLLRRTVADITAQRALLLSHYTLPAAPGGGTVGLPELVPSDLALPPQAGDSGW